MSDKRVTKAQLGHLRRLLAWLRCEIGPDAYELVSIAKSIAPAVGELTPYGKERMNEAGEQAMRTPRYVRNAIVQLEKLVADLEAEDGQVIGGEAFTAEGLPKLPEMLDRA